MSIRKLIDAKRLRAFPQMQSNGSDRLGCGAVKGCDIVSQRLAESFKDVSALANSRPSETMVRAMCRIPQWSRSLSLAVIAATGLALFVTADIARGDALELARAGFVAKEHRQFALAIQLFDEALRQGSFAKEPHGFLVYSRGVSYEGLGVRDKALADFDTAIALLPDFPNSYIYRGLIWVDQREYDRAIEDFLHAGRLNPKDSMVFNNLGGVYEKKGDFDRAIESYDQAIRLQPNYAGAYYNRAQAYIGKQDVERALADYDQAIWLQPNFADAFGNRGVLYLARGQSNKAIADFGTAIRLSPRDVTFWTNRGNANLTIGKYGDALRDFDQALQIDPGNPSTYLGRGRARLFAGDTTASVEDFKTAIRLRPSNPYPVIWLHIARTHNGEADRDEFAENAAKVRRDFWPTALLDYYLGTMDSEQVRAVALNGPAREKEKRICEAEFYLGEFAVHKGQPTVARTLLEAVLAGCRPYDVVYSAAVAELKLVPR